MHEGGRRLAMCSWPLSIGAYEGSWSCLDALHLFKKLVGDPENGIIGRLLLLHKTLFHDHLG